MDSPLFPTDLSHAANHFCDVGIWDFFCGVESEG